jgi:tetratricopeptide (TPR) repeat protein
MVRLEHAHDNFRAALAWSLSPDGVFAVGVALAGALGWFWLTSGRFQEAGYWYPMLIARQGEADDSVTWARMLHGSALQLWARGDLAQAAAHEEPAVETFRSAGEGRWLSYGLALLAQIHTAQDRPEEARVLLEEALGVWSQVKMTYGQPFDAYLRYYLGIAVVAQGDADSANAQFEASLREFRAVGDDLPRGVVLGSLGLLAARRGEHGQARARFAEGLPLLRGGEDQWDLAVLLLNSGLEEVLAASPTAGALLVEALRAWQQLGRPAGVAFALAGLGELAAGRGAPRRAGQLLGAGRALLPATDRLVRVVVPYDFVRAADRRPCGWRPGGIRSRPGRRTELGYRQRGHRGSGRPLARAEPWLKSSGCQGRPQEAPYLWAAGHAHSLRFTGTSVRSTPRGHRRCTSASPSPSVSPARRCAPSRRCRRASAARR